MAESKEARNKALVLKAFDTLFNKRDYATAERFWSPRYIQHSAHIEPGREGLMNHLAPSPATRVLRADREPSSRRITWDENRLGRSPPPSCQGQVPSQRAIGLGNFLGNSKSPTALRL
jgi:hypothetical protein